MNTISVNEFIQQNNKVSICNRRMTVKKILFIDSYKNESIMRIYIDIINKMYVFSIEFEHVLKNIRVGDADIIHYPLVSDNEVCAICIENLFVKQITFLNNKKIGSYQDGDEKNYFGQPDGCAHIFCGSCIYDYVRRCYTSCPICREEFAYVYMWLNTYTRPSVKRPNHFVKKQRQYDLSVFLIKNKIKLRH
ncbi:C3HC4 type zinc finger protein [Orgyia leucostigma nucleopolyhedrovirus]|uniref:C3HC4 type zinc finger protein n=1 Tax=Orgyia leucostigma nucleopolyhedrovirus TaxID=490711 RepID=B0FDX8_9ABAC|nr:C3HC4 type zinc finger protein [Orgyia leucostigma nucleopolyhedrovirus]ABY65836.1 C3HC4 type zinc finger protein [Orgyia leucostigma nucleopolyhedrovirus]